MRAFQSFYLRLERKEEPHVVMGRLNQRCSVVLNDPDVFQRQAPRCCMRLNFVHHLAPKILFMAAMSSSMRFVPGLLTISNKGHFSIVQSVSQIIVALVPMGATVTFTKNWPRT